MKYRFLPFLILLLVVLFGLNSCATEDYVQPSTDPDAADSFFNPKPETLVMDEGTNEDVRMFDVESGLLIYDEGSPQLDSIEVGSIIVSTANSASAGGFLRRVTAIENSGGRIVMETEPANLPDAFDSYRWVMNGDSRSGGRTDAGTFNADRAVADTFRFPIVGQPEWSFELILAVSYNMRFKSEFEYGFNGFSGQVNNLNLGVDNFSIDSLVMDMGFVREGMRDTEQNFNLADATPFFRELFSFTLAPIPVGPPGSPVMVTPNITVDFTTAMEYNVKLGQRFVFRTKNRPFTGLAQVNSPGGAITFVTVYPDMTVNADLYVDGTFSYGSGISIAVGLAPYTRSLFSLGARVTAGPKLTLTGDASIGLRDGTPTVDGQINAKIELDASAGVFVDPEFFGFAPDTWDVEQTLWENSYELWSAGIDNSCNNYFNTLYAESRCNNGNAQLAFSVARNTNSNLDLSGTYDVYVDNLLVAVGYSPETTHTIALPASLNLGPHTVRFVREGGGSVLFCQNQVNIIISDCSGSDVCTGVTSVTDARTNQEYCVRAFNDKNWFAENLNTTFPGSNQRRCYGNNPGICETYGGLYTFNEMFPDAGEGSPEEIQGLCPQGYHVPTVAEWLNLFGASGVTANSSGVYNLPEANSAFPFRASTTWNIGNNPQNPNGFNALASGFYNFSNNSGYTGQGILSYFLTSETSPSDTGGESGAYIVLMDGTNNLIKIAPAPRTVGVSCRCVAD